MAAASHLEADEKDKPLSMVTVITNLRPQWGEAGLSILAMFLYAIGAGYEGDALTVVNTVGPILFSAGLIWGIISLLQRSANNLWVPLFWFRVAMVVYFGVGALVPLYVNEATRAMIQGFYDFYPRDLLKLNILLTTFHLLIITFSTLIMSFFTGLRRAALNSKKPMISKSNFSLGLFGAVCLIVGEIINVFVVLPAVLRLYDATALGQLTNIAMASLLGYFMLTLWALRNKSGWLYLIIIAAALETLLGLLQMSKLLALFPGVMIGLGFVFHKPTLRRLITFAVTMMFVFTTLTPVIGYARAGAATAYAGDATPLEIASIYLSYYSNNTIVEVDENSQQGWARLSYVNAGTFAINRYDDGRPGNTLRYAPIIWVPRLIYPDKPHVTDISREFTFEVNGNYNSASTPGLPAEAYWDMGWLGVVVFSAILALTFTLWSFYTYIVIEREAWHLFFVVLLGMRTASRMDGGFVADIMGPIGLALLAHIIIQLLNRFLPERLGKILARKSKRPPPRTALTAQRYSRPQS